MSLVKAIAEDIKVGMIFKNPGGGTSQIVMVTGDKITYKRGNSNISLSLQDIDDAYYKFKSKQCTSSELKNFRKKVFSSKDNGHSCNCTFLFSLLGYLDLCTDIKGKGVRGNPFYVEIF